MAGGGGLIHYHSSSRTVHLQFHLYSYHAAILYYTVLYSRYCAGTVANMYLQLRSAMLKEHTALLLWVNEYNLCMQFVLAYFKHAGLVADAAVPYEYCAR